MTQLWRASECSHVPTKGTLCLLQGFPLSFRLCSLSAGIQERNQRAARIQKLAIPATHTTHWATVPIAGCRCESEVKLNHGSTTQQPMNLPWCAAEGSTSAGS